MTAIRPLPELTAENEHFWTGGKDGHLLLLRCSACGYWLHPPGPICPACLGTAVRPEAAAGSGSVAAFTINHQQWYPGLEVPYVVAMVDLPEQEGLRITTNIVGCAPEEVGIGMAVQVTFQQVEDIYLPCFTPVSGGTPAFRAEQGTRHGATS